MAIIIKGEQRTDEWFRAIAGNPGASGISKIITNSGLPSESATDYMYQLAGEVLAGKKEETYQSFAMQAGVEREDEARMVFSMEKETEVEQVSLIYKNKDMRYHVSPDGLINENAGLEIKCPMMKTQVKRLIEKGLPAEYFSQVQMSLYVSEREFWYFFSYYPDLPLFILKVVRDEAFIKKLEPILEQFCDDLESLIERIKSSVL